MCEEDFCFIKQVSLFEGLTAQQHQNILKIASLKNYAHGEFIIHEGEIGNEMFIVRKGTVEISKEIKVKTKSGKYSTFEKKLVVLESGAHPFFGEVALMQGETRTATARAITDCQLLVINNTDFTQLMDIDTALGHTVLKRICRVMCARLRKANEDITKLTTALSIAIHS